METRPTGSQIVAPTSVTHADNLHEIQKCSLTPPVRFQVTIDPRHVLTTKPEQSSLNRRVDPRLDVNCFCGVGSPAGLSPSCVSRSSDFNSTLLLLLRRKCSPMEEQPAYTSRAALRVSSIATAHHGVFKWPRDACIRLIVPRLRPHRGATRHSLCQNPIRYGKTPSPGPM
jgi:hypothetical protein